MTSNSPASLIKEAGLLFFFPLCGISIAARDT